jgi:DNA replication protein DnaC
MIENTKDDLAKMKILGMLSTMDTRLEEATAANWGHIEFLSALTQDEKLYRDNRKTARLRKAARFRVDASFEKFDLTAKRSITRAQLQDLMQLQFIKNPRNIVILGPTGVGKTYLASAIGDHACRNGYSTRFFGMNYLIENLALARADGTYLRFRDRLIKTDLLIIDDIGIKPLSPETIQDLYDLMEERYAQKSTIFTSQLPLENWREVISDEVAYDAIMDRLVHSAMRLELSGDSYRKKQGATGHKS